MKKQELIHVLTIFRDACEARVRELMQRLQRMRAMSDTVKTVQARRDKRLNGLS
jgi:hypothetical protein